MDQKLIKNGFILAAAMNFSVIIFSRGFTNTAINEADPIVMSNFGLLMIFMWGLAYLASVSVTTNIKWLAGVFTLEKLIYAAVWIKWMTENSLSPIYAKDIFAGVFYSVYGVSDFIFMLFFAWVFCSCYRAK